MEFDEQQFRKWDESYRQLRAETGLSVEQAVDREFFLVKNPAFDYYCRVGVVEQSWLDLNEFRYRVRFVVNGRKNRKTFVYKPDSKDFYVSRNLPELLREREQLESLFRTDSVPKVLEGYH